MWPRLRRNRGRRVDLMRLDLNEDSEAGREGVARGKGSFTLQREIAGHIKYLEGR
jgi:hypothetical protein